jgi:hypothetical protein
MDKLILFVIFSFVAFLLLCVAAYAALILFLLVKKRWKPAVMMIVIAAFLCASPSLYIKMKSRRFFQNTFNVAAELVDPIHEYSNRDFQGDGATFDVYELPESIRERFESPDKEWMSDYPLQLEDYAMIPWQESPIEPRTQKYIEFAMGLHDPNSAKEGYLSKAHQAIRRENAFYSICFKTDGENLRFVCVYIVDLEDSLIYINSRCIIM